MSETTPEPFSATGGCLCGDVRWGLIGRLPPVGFCHCSQCRRVSGTGSNAVLHVKPDRFVWICGEDQRRDYVTPTGWRTTFCAHCGCPAPHLGGHGRWFVPAGSLDGDVALNVSGHIFVEDKPDWAVIGDESPQFAGWPPAS